MIYSSEEKLRMDRLLATFSDYVAHSQDIDIAYSDKSGFVRLIIEECADTVFFPITSFDDMLSMFLGDFLLNEETRVQDYQCIDYDRLRCRLTPRLSGLGEDSRYSLDFISPSGRNAASGPTQRSGRSCSSCTRHKKSRLKSRDNFFSTFTGRCRTRDSRHTDPSVGFRSLHTALQKAMFHIPRFFP